MPILPLIIVAVAAMVVLLVGVRVDDDDSDGLGILSIALLVFAAILTLLLFGGRPSLAFSGALAVDSYSAFFELLILFAAAMTASDVARVRRRAGVWPAPSITRC